MGRLIEVLADRFGGIGHATRGENCRLTVFAMADNQSNTSESLDISELQRNQHDKEKMKQARALLGLNRPHIPCAKSVISQKAAFFSDSLSIHDCEYRDRARSIARVKNGPDVFGFRFTRHRQEDAVYHRGDLLRMHCRNSMKAYVSSSQSSIQKVAYVACNVYVSAGGEIGHRPILLNLLRQAQGACQPGKVGIVHAYTDQAYNRSSFHLVGQAEPLSRVAATLASQAIHSLRSYTAANPPTSTLEEDQAHHPYVGCVDHIAIMPVEGKDSINDTNESDNDDFVPSTPSGTAARQVGKVLQESGTSVYYYGSAHPKATSLATVRREKTQFFKSGGLSNESGDVKRVEVATVGAPLEFVENYNIRMKPTCPKNKAQSLTKCVRERNGGLKGVEALTLPYSEGRWEIACNLLEPGVASSDDIDDLVKSWEEKESANYVESAYRVGTTAKQCLECITSFDDNMWEKHNAQVEDRLNSYLS